MAETKRPIGRPPRDVPRVAVTVRFEPADLARIDGARGDISRQDWLARAALEFRGDHPSTETERLARASESTPA